MLVDTPLTKNLTNPKYVNIILSGKPSLEERLADIDIHIVRKELRTFQSSAGKVPAKIKKLIKDQNEPPRNLSHFVRRRNYMNPTASCFHSGKA